MAGNARFELTSGSSEPGFVGNYPNGQKGNHSGPNLDRSGSFREGVESRQFGSGIGMSRGSGSIAGDLPPLSQCLTLEPIIMDKKCTRSGELRRVMGFSVGSSTEDNSFGAAHLKPSPPVATEELKRFRSSVVDTCIKARGRAKKLDEHLLKLNRYCEAVNSKKQQRNELSANERSGGLNLKMGTQIHRNPPDLVNQKMEDRSKNVILSKRIRTSVAETRAECRSNNGIPRQPPVTSKDRDLLRDSSADSDLVEEKIRRLPAGAEGWDKKMKRKRSVGTVSTRPIDNERELKRTTHHKLSSEPGLQPCDAHSFRSGASNGTSGINKMDGISLPASSNARVAPKNEQERAALPRDLSAGLNKERLLVKGNYKLKNFEDNHVTYPTPVTKGKASRAPRTGSTVATNSSPNIPHVSGTLEGWEHQPSVNKVPSIGGTNNRKHAITSGSSSSPMAQWVGQRPPKFSRTRRANLVSPVSNHDDMQISSEGCPPSDFGARLTSSGTNGSLLSRNTANGTQQFNVKLENVQSPARLSESEESGAGENRLKEKGMGSGNVEEKAVDAVQDVGLSATLAKKNKFLVKDELGEGVRRQGRSGRGPSFPRSSISPVREKLDNAATTKPLRSTRPGSEKIGSKSGRPMKKLLDRKSFSRLGHMQNSCSPDFTGESEDDREELLAAANSAYNASYLACSSPFWKTMEPIFASVSSKDKTYASQQLKFAEELTESLPQMFGHGNNILGDDVVHDETSVSDTLISGESNRHLLYQIGSEESAGAVEFVEQQQEVGSLFGRLDSERRFNKVNPLFQIVLSALIVEDEIEEFEKNNVGRNISAHDAATTNSPYDTCLLINAEPRKCNRPEFECDSMSGVQNQRHGAANRFMFCNGSTDIDRSPNIPNPQCNDEMLKGGSAFAHSEISSNDLDGPQIMETKGFGISSSDCQYEQMCLNDKLLLELQSIGLYPETVPHLDDTEDEVINQEILQLNRRLHQQIGKKKECLEKICKAIGSNAKGRDLEQVAMDRLVELAYKKLLATRGTSKGGVVKVSKQVALAFAKRTLDRCRKFEDSGTSCFSEPALRDIIFAPPPWGNEAESLTSAGLAVASDKHLSSHNLHSDPRASSGSLPSSADGGLSDMYETFSHISDEAFAKNGPISNRGRKKEVLLDDVVGSTALRATSILGSTLLSGTKGKRSEREREKDASPRNAVAKGGRPSQGNFKGERKTKTKPKQKTAQLSTSGNRIVTKFTESTHPVYPSASTSGELVNNSGNRKREVRLISPGNVPQDSSKESKEPMDLTNLPLHDLDPIEELGASADLGGHQDLTSLFNFEVDGLEEHFSAGLEIPMDDISFLF